MEVVQVSRSSEMETGLQNSHPRNLRLRLTDQVALIPVPVLKGLGSTQLQNLEIFDSPVFAVQWMFLPRHASFFKTPAFDK